MTTEAADLVFLLSGDKYVTTCGRCGAPCAPLAWLNGPLGPWRYKHIGQLVRTRNNDSVRAPIWRDLDSDHEAVPA